MDTPTLTAPPVAAGYERDFHARCTEQAASLRARARPGVNDGLDYANLAEEIAGLASSKRHAIASHLKLVMLHLFKWKYHPSKRSDGWIDSIVNGQDEIADIIEESPNLAGYANVVFEKAYARAVRDAVRQTGIPRPDFPSACPYTIEQILDPEFLPDEAGSA